MITPTRTRTVSALTARILAGSIAALLAVPCADAATLTWDANGATAGQTDGAGAWLTANQWWDGAANTIWVSGDDAIFGNAGAGGAVTLASPTTVNSLTFNSFTGTYTLGTATQAITLNNGITKNAGTAATIISPITLGAAQSWTNSSTGLLTIGPAAMTNGGFLLTVAGSGNITVSGVISGSGGLTKLNGGTLTLSGANTFGGDTTLNGGVLTANSTAALGDGSVTNTLIFAGGTLRAGGAITSAATRGVTLTSTGIIDTNTFAVSIAGNMTGGGGLTKAGFGNLIFSGTNNYSGITTVNAGILTFATQASLYNGTPASWTAANINVKSGGTLAVNVDSAGTNGFDATNLNTLIGNVSVANTAAEGLQRGASLGFDTSTATGGIFTQVDVIANSTGAFGGTIGLAKLGAGTLVLDKANTYTGQTIVSAGTLQIDPTGGISAAPLLNNGSLIVNKTGTLTQGINFPATIGGTGALTYSGGGTLVLNAPNLYSGATTLSAGSSITLSHALALQNSALATSAGTFTLSGGITTPTFGGLSGATGDLASVISSGYGGVTNLTLKPIVGSTVTYGGVIADGAVGMTLTKTGAGTQVLQGVNIYTGATTLNAGTLELSGSGSILTTPGITLTGGALTLANTAAETGSGRVHDTNGITSNGGTITYTNTSGADVYAETIGPVALTSGQLNLVETTNQVGGGSQTLTLGGLTRTGATNTSAVTFSAGTTAPNATTNIIAVTGAAQTTAGQIIAPWATTGTAATLQNDYAIYNASGQVVPSGITNSAEFNWTNPANAYAGNTGGVITLTGLRQVNALQFLGAATTLALSTFNLETSGILFPGANAMIVSSAGGSLTTASGGGNLYITAGRSGVLQTISALVADNNGMVTLVKSGAGTLTLSNSASSFTGGIVINAGQINASAALASLGTGSADIVFNGSARLAPFNGSSPRGITINNGALAEIGGNGTYTFSGNVTGTGGIVASAFNFGFNVFLTGTANTFEGPVVIGLGSGTGGQSFGVTLASLADSPTANGRILFNSQVTHPNGSVFGYTGSTNLVLDNRQLEFAAATTNPVNGHQIRSSGTGTLTINTDLIVSTAVAQTLSLRGTNTGANTFAGKIVDGPGAVISLTKLDAGTWVLSGANSYAGATTVGAGTLVATNATALGATALGTTVTSGATFDVHADITTEAISVGGTGVGGNGALVASTGTGTVGGAVTLTANTSIGGDGILNVNGVVAAGAFTLTKVGAGTTNLGATSTLTSVGTLTTNGGTTNVGSALGAGTSIVNANAATNFSTSQTLAALNIGAGAVVTLGAPAGAPAAFGGEEMFAQQGEVLAGGATQAVPEPGSAALLLGGLATLLGLRRRKA